MEQERPTILTISDLIHRAQPLTAASSLTPRRHITTSRRHKKPDTNHHHKPSFNTLQNPTPQTLKPFHHPTPLIGTLTLPSFVNRNSPIQCNCFQFSDDSATLCCEVLDFDPNMIGRKIKLLSWNFIPLKSGNRGASGGFLEIVSWGFIQVCSVNVCSLSGFDSFCLSLGVCGARDSSKAGSLVFGVIESISPVFVVPCATRDSGSRNVCGFLVNVLACRCKTCVSKSLVSELKIFSEDGIKDHYFVQTVIVYFCGLTSSWHPVISRLVGDVVLLSGLKKKLVFVSKDESQMMYVTTDEVSLHFPKLFKDRGSIHDSDVRGRGECRTYTGVITGIYMQGMVVELDRDVILILTDQHLSVPHCVRVGAIVTLKNVHFLDPKFPWGNMLILGACYRTSMYMQSFSPWETGCHSKSHSKSLLMKFIDSLSFPARLWALLVVSCFRRKFAGILSEKEILGSKHKEGLAQKYATLHLPLSAFHFRHGILLEFCKHDLCCGEMEAHCGQLRLVAPIANLISYCEASWKNTLDGISQKKPLLCGGKSYLQSIRRVLRTEEIGVSLMGIIKVSLSSGRLQLVDATGGVDIMLELAETWDFARIFEAKDFRLITEGIPPKLVDLDLCTYWPLSCRSIFSNTQPLRRTKTWIYLYPCPTDDDSRSRALFFDWNRNAEELESGKYHLLMLTHKFPLQQNFQGTIAKRSNMFAEVIILPWDILVAGKYKDSVTNTVSSGHFKDSMENFIRPEKHLKRCNNEQVLVGTSNYSFSNGGNGLSGHLSGSSLTYNAENTYSGSAHPFELSCLIASECVDFHYLGTLQWANEHAEVVSGCKPPRRIVLEFDPDGFCKYEALKIGRCYLIKHQEEDTFCSGKGIHQAFPAKVFISSATRIRSLKFSSIESLLSTDVFPISNIHIGNDGTICKQKEGLKIPCLTYNGIGSDISSDITVFIPSSALGLLENAIKGLRDSFQEEAGICGHGYMKNASMQSSGTSCSNYPLPVGNLINLHGSVLAFHDCDGDSFSAQSRPVTGEGYLPMFLKGDGGVCVHVLVDNQIVKIFFDGSKHRYPIGWGRDINATFHRILVLSDQNKYMMTPVSFITIDCTSLMSGHISDEIKYASGVMNGHPTDELEYASGAVGLFHVASPSIAPPALIYDALQLSELKTMQFRCRIVAVYVLVLEKARATAVSKSICSVVSAFEIPFAGFIIDDGSSSCCCWANSERATALLGLQSENYAEAFVRSMAGKGKPKRSTISHLNQIVEKHGRVVVKNYGSIFDSSCQDLSFSVDSDRSLCSSDRDLLLRSFSTSAFFSTSWNIVGSLIDPKATSWLEERLSELNMTTPPLLNIWAMNVCHTDMLAEARNIIQGLV